MRKRQTNAVTYSANDLESFAYGVAQKTRSTIKVLSTYTNVFQGFSVHGTEDAAREFTRNKQVKFVEQNRKMSIAGYKNPIWGLDRIDQRDLPLDNCYAPMGDETGSDVYAYILDTGVRTNHTEFEGRATWGTNTIDDFDEDSGGHGTHVAGTVGGKTYGVAKNVNLVSVKVLTNRGGSSKSVIGGLEWVMGDASGKKAVANLSLGGGKAFSIDLALKNLRDVGVLSVVAAGNDSDDACNYSPARGRRAITVGSVGIASPEAGKNTITEGAEEDIRSSFSNYGECVDIFAPGENIESASHASDSGAIIFQGTSMASPHVAGAIAIHLENGASPVEAEEHLYEQSTKDKVVDKKFRSPNRLLYIGHGTPCEKDSDSDGSFVSENIDILSEK
mmetsp:Transcript_38905/g.90506  ORF Transcript_38905/g.90506 Transcript_38905/m.90506 type:complete len:390 (-) Transcript_38905:273-1442(-)